MKQYWTLINVNIPIKYVIDNYRHVVPRSPWFVIVKYLITVIQIVIN